MERLEILAEAASEAETGQLVALAIKPKNGSSQKRSSAVKRLSTESGASEGFVGGFQAQGRRGSPKNGQASVPQVPPSLMASGIFFDTNHERVSDFNLSVVLTIF